jgi:hypothetical protein
MNDVFDGNHAFLRAFSRVLAKPALRRWYLRTLLKTVALAFLLLALLGGFGLWAVGSSFESFWATSLAVLLWLVALAFLSGTLSTLLLNVIVQVAASENGLFALYASDAAQRQGVPWTGRDRVRDLSREYGSMLRGLAVACVAWPLLLVPFLMPVGVCVFAWVVASDALSTANRLCHAHGIETLQDRAGGKLPGRFRVGLGFVPSALALFPVFGWVLLPLLQAAALEAQLDQNPMRGDRQTF